MKNKNLDIKTWNGKHLSRKQPLIRIPIASRVYETLSMKETFEKTEGTWQSRMENPDTLATSNIQDTEREKTNTNKQQKIKTQQTNKQKTKP